MRTRIIGARIGDRARDVLVENGHIAALLAPGDLADCEQTVKADGARLLPGLIDVHSHGCVGYDTMDAGSHFHEMSRFYFEHGVTTWYPTTMTASPEGVLAALSQKTDYPDGAHTPGFHIEGPYISEKYKGAQNAAFIRPPDITEFGRFTRAARVTVAPELPGAIDFIKKCPVPVSLGHTEADYDTALAAFRAGARSLTHTCNAMPPLLHRAPGPIGAALVAGAYAEVISDGLHIAEAMILALYRIFGPERMVLISDSMHATGLSDGVYDFGGQPVTVKNGVARTAEGALAGSTTCLFDCVKRAVSFGIPAEDAFRMASTTPAEMMGLRKGRIAVGYDADFILLDENYNLLRTLIL